MSALENSGPDRNPDAGQEMNPDSGPDRNPDVGPDMNPVVGPDMNSDEDETVRMSAGKNGGNRSMKR